MVNTPFLEATCTPTGDQLRQNYLYSSKREFRALIEDPSSEAVTLLWTICYSLLRAVGTPATACVAAKLVSLKANWKTADSTWSISNCSDKGREREMCHWVVYLRQLYENCHHLWYWRTPHLFTTSNFSSKMLWRTYLHWWIKTQKPTFWKHNLFRSKRESHI